jgi:hypothetical protein
MIDKSVPSQFSSIKLDQLVYVELESRNGGMMLTVSDEGFTFRAVSSVRPSGRIPFSFIIHGTEKLEGYGEITWTKDEGKVAGLQFTDISTEFLNALRKWLTELSAPATPAAAEAGGDSTFNLNHGLKTEPPKSSSAEPIAETGPKPELGMNFGQSLGGAARQNEVPPAAPQSEMTAAAPLPRTTHILSDWNYAEVLPAESPTKGNGVVIAAVVACLLLLAILLFSLRETIGRSLISLGQKLSAPSGASQAEAPDNPESAGDAQPPTPNPGKENSTSSNTADKSSQPPAATPSGADKPEAAKPQVTREKSEPLREKAEQFRDEKPAPPGDEGAAKPTRSQHPAEDVRSLWSAVGQGNTAAEVTLAKLYMIGGGVPKNCDQARVLLKAAVKKGNTEAITTLSQLNRQGCP